MAHTTIFRILKEDVGLVKKSTRWIPCLLTRQQMECQKELSEDFVWCAGKRPKKFLACIVTMDKSAVSFHTPETKNQSKQWLPKGAVGPLKVRVQASRKKQMVFPPLTPRTLSTCITLR